MSEFFETIQYYWSIDFIRTIIIRAMIIGIPVALCASLLGVSLVLKRYSMIGDGLSHVGFGALSIAAALNLNTDGGNYSYKSLLICLPIVIIAAFMLLRLTENSKIKGDAAIALVSTGAIAVGYIIYSLSGKGSAADVCGSLFGRSSIISIDAAAVPFSIGLSVIVLTVYFVSYTKVFSITFDESFASATGVHVKSYNIIISLLTAITIVLGMQLVGAIMISGLIIFPTLTAMRLCKTFRSVVIVSGAVSVLCFVIGFFIATVYKLPTGPTVIAINLLLFIVFTIISFAKGKASVA